MAFYRTLDPATGHWWSVDPKAEAARGMSTYCAMGNNPVKYNDPNGDVIPAIAAAILGGVIGGASYSISSAYSGNQMTWGGFAKGVGYGAIGGAVSFGVGSAFGGAGSFGIEAGRAGAHALSGGGLSALQGGDFWSGALAGGIGSGVGSGITGLGGGSFEQLAGGAFSGGVGSVLGGGNFFSGAATGIYTGLLNHAAHCCGEGAGIRQGIWRNNTLEAI